MKEQNLLTINKIKFSRKLIIIIVVSYQVTITKLVIVSTSGQRTDGTIHFVCRTLPRILPALQRSLVHRFINEHHLSPVVAEDDVATRVPRLIIPPPPGTRVSGSGLSLFF